MVRKPRVVLDTNILISGILFGGKPGEIINLVIDEKVSGITSSILLAELIEVLNKKFEFPQEEIELIKQEIEESFLIANPKKPIHKLNDEDDNRVLEAAVEGKCDVIVTGDKELLELAQYRNIKIITPEEFLKTRV